MATWTRKRIEHAIAGSTTHGAEVTDVCLDGERLIVMTRNCGIIWVKLWRLRPQKRNCTAKLVTTMSYGEYQRYHRFTKGFEWLDLREYGFAEAGQEWISCNVDVA